MKCVLKNKVETIQKITLLNYLYFPLKISHRYKYKKQYLWKDNYVQFQF